MSISNNSINDGDDLTPAENDEVDGDAINLDNDGQFDGEKSKLITDRQQLKESREKIAKMEMELKMAKLELENQQERMGEQQEFDENTELEKQLHETTTKSECFSQLHNDQKKILEKISEFEKQQKEQTKATADQLSKILEKISEFEKQREEQSKASADQFSKIMEKITELEKQHENMPKATSDQFSKVQNDQSLFFFRQNYWDANVCHKNLEIIDDKSLTVHHKGNDYDWSSVFAKHPILLDNNSSNLFYYEISVKNNIGWVFFGFAFKQHIKLDWVIENCGTYGYENDGEIWINKQRKGIKAEHSYGVGDTVGIGVNSATRQIIFTKNGLRLDSFNDFFVAPRFADDSLHPFVSLCNFDEKIEANFGPNFKFDLTTL
ncbi:hypothetical protein niasHT_000147 [Heterodera trifolii]|uniref:B30.2/SPRY domain-containing protein n=1 Tax=Heterodera trifolii TaxID=157864 RepID=A0ABD2LQ82_9BILA